MEESGIDIKTAATIVGWILTIITAAVGLGMYLQQIKRNTKFQEEIKSDVKDLHKRMDIFFKEFVSTQACNNRHEKK